MSGCCPVYADGNHILANLGTQKQISPANSLSWATISKLMSQSHLPCWCDTVKNQGSKISTSYSENLYIKLSACKLKPSHWFPCLLVSIFPRCPTYSTVLALEACWGWGWDSRGRCTIAGAVSYWTGQSDLAMTRKGKPRDDQLTMTKHSVCFERRLLGFQAFVPCISLPVIR